MYCVFGGGRTQILLCSAPQGWDDRAFPSRKLDWSLKVSCHAGWRSFSSACNCRPAQGSLFVEAKTNLGTGPFSHHPGYKAVRTLTADGSSNPFISHSLPLPPQGSNRRHSPNLTKQVVSSSRRVTDPHPCHQHITTLFLYTGCSTPHQVELPFPTRLPPLPTYKYLPAEFVSRCIRIGWTTRTPMLA